MNFSNKLIFLMELTSTNSSQLASILKVDPSLISRLRNGTRKLPKNAVYLQPMIDYFASRITKGNQRVALLSAIGLNTAEFKENLNVPQILTEWLDNSASVMHDGFLDHIRKIEKDKYRAAYLEQESAAIEHGDKTEIYTFYGEFGKRNANLLFEELILSSKSKGQIKILTEGNLDWLWKDKQYAFKVSENIRKAVNRGWQVTRIEPINQSISMAFDTVNRWFPLFLSSRVNSYYYPFIRDHIFNSTLYVAPGVAALSSISIGNHANELLTVVTTDAKMINAYNDTFDDYLKLCKPTYSMFYYRNNKTIKSKFENFYGKNSDCVTILSGLSLINTPTDILTPNGNMNNSGLDAIYLKERFNIGYQKFKNNLLDYRCSEVITLDSLEDVLNGKVQCYMNTVFQGSPSYYTAEMYSKHLKNIICMLETYPNYSISISNKNELNSNIYIKDGSGVLIFPPNDFGAFYKLEYHESIASIWNYARAKVSACYSSPNNRDEVLSTLREYTIKLDALNKQ